MRRFVVSLLSLIVLGLGLAGGWTETSLGAATESSLEPTIVGVEPETARRWSYVAISGADMMNSDGTCDVTIGDLAAYISDCGDKQIVAIVPWTAPNGDVVVSRDGVPSNVHSVQLLPATGSPRDADIVRGSIEVQLAPNANLPLVADRLGASEGDFSSMAASAQGVDERWYSVDVPDGQEIDRAISYSTDQGISYAGPRSVPRTTDVPNDEFFDDQWALAKISAENAWTISKGDSVKIAVIDTGFATNHPDLQAHMLPGWNCNGGSSVSALSSHGTWTAGVAAAVTNNGPGPGSGIAGVGWNSRIVPLRLDSLGGLGSCPGNGFEFLVDQAINAGAAVINASIIFSWPAQFICDQTTDAWEAGVVVIASAGNDNSTALQAPAACPNVVAVGATGPNDAKAGYSNHGSWLDISAPGGTGVGPPLQCTGDITSLVYTTNSPSGYATVCGTSFAAPHVSGVAALLASQGFYNCQITKALLSTESVDPIGWSGGVGRVNALKALDFWAGGPIVSAGNFPDYALVQGEGQNEVYVAQGGRKYHIPNPTVFSQMGFDWHNVQCVPLSVLNSVPTTNISNPPPSKTLLEEFDPAPGSDKTYIYIDGFCEARFHVPNLSIMNSLIQNGHANAPRYPVPPGGATQFSDTPGERCYVAHEAGVLGFVVCDLAAGGTGLWRVPDVLTGSEMGLTSATLQVLWPPDPGPPAVPDPLAFPIVPRLVESCKDDDDDGFSDLAELYLKTAKTEECLTGTNYPSIAWPLDLSGSTSPPNSHYRINIQDLATFVAPTRYLNTNRGTHTDPDDIRWDLWPGKGIFTYDINIQDMGLMVTNRPPMFNGQRAFLGPACDNPPAASLLPPGGGPTYSSEPAGAFSIDLNPSESPANTTTSLGTVEECGAIFVNGILDGDEDAVDAREVDVTASGIPVDNPMIGFGYTLGYDEAALSVTALDSNSLIGSVQGSSPVDASSSVPDTDGDGMWNGGQVDTAGTEGASGSGILHRLTIGGDSGAVEGVYDLTLSGAGHINPATEALAPTALNGAQIAVDTYCPATDSDGDGVFDEDEAMCGGDPYNDQIRPERIDGVFAGVDDDGDTVADEALPAGSGGNDCDGDGYTGDAEGHVYAPSTVADQDPCGSNILPPTVPASPIGWPADLRGDGASANDVDIFDLASFSAPVRYLNTNVGTNPGDLRWDIIPGPGPLSNDINILDLSALSNGATAYPAMLAGARALNGPPCPWPQ